MRKLVLMALSLALFAAPASAQRLLNNFDTFATDANFNLYGTGLDTLAGGKAYMRLTDDPTDPFEGDAALKCEWQVHTTETWGGFLQIQFLVDDAEDLLDISLAEYVSIMFNNHVPSSQPGKVTMRFKIHDAADGRGALMEDWYFETNAVYDNTVPGWQELLIPLREIENPVGTAPNNQGFSLPGWSGSTSGNQKLDFDKVQGFSIEWPSAVIDGEGTANGVVSWDALRLKGHRNPVINLFESAATDTNIAFAGTGASSIAITDNTDDAFEGTAAQLDWFVQATESWGGYASITVNYDTLLPDMSGFTHISLMYNNLVKQNNPGEATLRIELHDFSDSPDNPEVWYSAIPGILDADPGWQQLLLPLEDLGVGTFPSAEGFSNPGWAGSPGNGKLDFDKIGAFIIEFSAATQGSETNGTILFDNMELYGFRETDVTAPEAVQNLLVATTEYVNVITWQDVPGEVGEKYDIYYSGSPITDISTAEVVALGVSENNQVAEHRLVAPINDKQVSYYYAITATDKVGNVSDVTTTPAPVTNTAKGIVTISITPPPNFAADGDLSEWSSITPFRMFPSEGAPIVTNTTVTDDEDLSVLAYLAVDNEYLYIAFDVTDDVTSPNVAVESWLNDGADLFIGLYNWHGAPHRGYDRGAAPDYHFRFNKGRAILDNLAGVTVLTADSADYFWGEKFINGYTIETRIRWTHIASFGNDAVFSPVEGYRIPLDFAINDADGAPREGIMTFSPYNEDRSWQTPSRWVFTWLGALDTPVGVEDGEPNVPFSYRLSQNYPNPFNPTTTIQYALAKPGQVTIALFNVLGQKVRTLVDEFKPAGEYAIKLDANGLASGLYFYNIKSGEFAQTRKMIIMK